MISKAANLQTYIAELPPESRTVIEKLRMHGARHAGPTSVTA